MEQSPSREANKFSACYGPTKVHYRTYNGPSPGYTVGLLLHCWSQIRYIQVLTSAEQNSIHRPLLLSNGFIRTSEDKIDTAVPEQHNSNFSLLVSSSAYIHKYLLVAMMKVVLQYNTIQVINNDLSYVLNLLL